MIPPVRRRVVALPFSMVFFLIVPLLPALAGERVTYDGSDPSALQDGSYISGVLAPQGIANDKTDSLSDNSVTMTGGAAGNIVGGYNGVDSDAVTGNKVFVDGGTAGSVTGGVFGGYAGNPFGNNTAHGNSVTVRGGVINDGAILSGGFAGDTLGDAAINNNSVTISGGAIGENVAIYGGHSDSSMMSGNADVNGNSVTISGGTIGDDAAIYGNYVHGATDAITANDGSVTISGGRIGSRTIIRGASAQSSLAGITANNASVTISGVTIDSVARLPTAREAAMSWPTTRT